MVDKPILKKADFESDQAVRWCPGCGDYAILAQTQKIFPEITTEKEKVVFISGIGCSSRFPYYMNTYGFHTIHGRAPTVASGLKISNPDLSVWLVTGDGDGFSIGGNHLIHLLRRNIDLNVMLFNNRIYGLTKGQYSPTSEQGKVTYSTPMGSLDYPFNPTKLALGAKGAFVAKTIDRDLKHLQSMIKRSSEHKGTSFIEIYQNCNIFNDGAFSHVTEKKTKAQNQLFLSHGKPLVFGSEGEKGIVFRNFKPEVADVADVGIENIHVHDEEGEVAYHMALAQMTYPDFPVPLGVIRAVEGPSYDELINAQVAIAQDKKGKGALEDLIRGPSPWTVD